MIAIKNLFITILFPPIWSAGYYLISIFKNKNSKDIVSLLFVYSLIIVYSIQSYDNRLRFRTIMDMGEYSSFFEDHALNWIVYYVKQYIDISCTIFFFLYSFLCLLFYYIINKKLHETFSYSTVIVILTGISIKNLYDLNYSTFSCVFLLFCLLCIKMQLLKYIIALIGCYIIHPVGVLLLVFAAPLCFFISKKQYNNCYLYISILTFLCFTLFVINNQFDSVGFKFIDYFIEKGNLYLDDDYFWTKKSNLTTSTLYNLFNMFENLLYLFFLLTTLFTLKKRILPPELSALIIIATILYFATLETVTFNERCGTAIYILGITALPLWAKNNIFLITKSRVAGLCLFMYFASMYFHPLVQEHMFGKNGFPEEVALRKYYMPGVLLLDINDFGMSDEMLKEKMK